MQLLERLFKVAPAILFTALAKANKKTIHLHSKIEYMVLVERDERLRNDRVQYLVELAQLRDVSLPRLEG
jgi:hypothetical protein